MWGGGRVNCHRQAIPRPRLLLLPHLPRPNLFKSHTVEIRVGRHDTVKQQGPRNFYHSDSENLMTSSTVFTLEDLFQKEKLKGGKKLVSSVFLVQKLLINYKPKFTQILHISLLSITMQHSCIFKAYLIRSRLQGQKIFFYFLN